MPNWKFYVERKFNYYIQWVQTQCTQVQWQNRAVGFSFPLQNYLILNGAEFFDADDRGAYDEFLDLQCQRDKAFMQKFIMQQYALIASAQEMERALKLLGDDLVKINNKTLAELYEKFLSVYIKIFSLAFLRPDEYLEKRTKEELLKLPAVREINLDEVFKLVACYPNKDLTQLDYLEEPIALLKIASEAKTEKKNLLGDKDWFAEKIQIHTARFSWMKNPFGYKLVKTSDEEYLTRLKMFMQDDPTYKLKKIMDERAVREFDVQLAVKTYGIVDEAFEYMNYSREAIYLRTFATEATDRLYYTARLSVFKEIADRFGAKEEDLATFTGEEVFDLLKNGSELNQEIIAQRKKAFAVTWNEGKSQMFFGKTAQDVFERYDSLIQENSKDGKITKLAGQVAYKGGMVSGPARVLKTSDDVHRVNEGDIIVVSMTTPDYILAMEKAAAFVTDEGGVTCHAAIIAREMQKPCLVGTVKATRVINDGDVIELDTERGIVSIKNV